MLKTEQKMNERPPFLTGIGFGNVSYCYWTGASGHRYIHSVYSLDLWPGHLDANIMLVRNCPDDGRQILWVGECGADHGQLSDPGILSWARANGANEIHVHLLGASAADRTGIVRDLQQIARVGTGGLARKVFTNSSTGR
jgi:hypothetical protein